MKHTLSAICTLSNLPQYKLDPPRGGNQEALVIVTAKTEDSFVIESVQFLNSDEAVLAQVAAVGYTYPHQGPQARSSME